MSDAADRRTMLSLIAVTAVRLCCALLVVKTLAHSLGPEHFGIVSQVMGIGAVFNMLAGGGATNGLIQAVSRTSDNQEREHWLATNLAIGIAAGAFLGLVTGAMYLTSAPAVFGDPTMATLFLGFGVAQLVIGLGNIVLAYCSATGQSRVFALSNIAGNLAWAAITVLASVGLGLAGATWAVALAPMCPAMIALFVKRRTVRTLLWHFPDVSLKRLLYLQKFVWVTLFAVCAVPVVHLVIRSDLAHRSGWQGVGQWQAIARLADAYMQVFGVLAINLLLPRLAAASTRASWMSVMTRIGGGMLVLFVVGALSLYGLGSYVISLAYSAEFLPALQYLAPQLLADFCKVGTWILIYHFVATGRVWVQASTEVLQAIGLLAGYFVLLPVCGVCAPVLANLAVCAALLIGLSLMVWQDKSRRCMPCGY